jgi:hypothetical protein
MSRHRSSTWMTEKRPLGRQRDEAAPRHLEQFEGLAVAGTVDGRRSDDRPVEARGGDQPLRLGLRPAVIGQVRLARRERGDVDEAAHAGLARGVDHGGGAGGVDRLEAGAGRGVDRSGDVDDGVGAGDQLDQGLGAVEGAVDPGDRRPRAASSRG